MLRSTRSFIVSIVDRGIASKEGIKQFHISMAELLLNEGNELDTARLSSLESLIFSLDWFRAEHHKEVGKW